MADEQCLYCNHKQGEPARGCERSFLEVWGKKYKRKHWWDLHGDVCPHCHTPSGRYHHSGCSAELCPRCKEYLVGVSCCTCFDEQEPEPVGAPTADRFKPLKGKGEHQAWVQDLADGGRVVCECYSTEDAERIASLLSKDHAERTGRAEPEPMTAYRCERCDEMAIRLPDTPYRCLPEGGPSHPDHLWKRVPLASPQTKGGNDVGA